MVEAAGLHPDGPRTPPRSRGWLVGRRTRRARARADRARSVAAVPRAIVCRRARRVSLRRWQGEGEPPFWRRASSAAGVVLLRALPETVPVVFAYAMLASEQRLPDRLDWLFYLTAEMVVIIFTVAALVTTTLAPRAPAWRLIHVSDAGAA